ncbi:uncharacterized protein LOC134209974 [Armigeres subalbatus]|uniref:uncharacterized protein LOC134209974 n=1 Tax=Armigeres subalbatus TaxID=124917 RepID=UPI002ED19ABF
MVTPLHQTIVDLKFSDVLPPVQYSLSDIMSRLIIQEFLELYRSLPCLWKMQCKDYANREMKTEAYKLMVRKLSELEPDANRGSVIKKINNMRSNYRKEKRKVQAFQKLGSQYVPTLWYYPLLGFLDGEDDFVNSDSDSIDIERVKVQGVDSPEPYVEDAYDTCSSPTTTEATNFELAMSNCDYSAEYPPVNEDVPSPSVENNPRKRKPEDMSHVDQNHFRIVSCEDRHDAFGRSIAFKLRALPDEQRIYAEKLINDAIYEAELGNLKRHCRIQLEKD